MTTSLSLNLMSILEYFRARGDRDNEQIAAYIDDIAGEAKALASVWEVAINGIVKDANRDKVEVALKVLRQSDWYIPCNGAHYSRLEYFYESFSTTATGKMPNARVNALVCQLANVIRLRDKSLERLEQILSDLKNCLFLHPDNLQLDCEDLSALPQILHREAAALEVLAKTIRVQQG